MVRADELAGHPRLHRLGLLSQRALARLPVGGRALQPMPVATPLPPGPGLGASRAELGAAAITAAAHPGPFSDQASVLGVGAACGNDRAVTLLTES